MPEIYGTYILDGSRRRGAISGQGQGSQASQGEGSRSGQSQ